MLHRKTHSIMLSVFLQTFVWNLHASVTTSETQIVKRPLPTITEQQAVSLVFNQVEYSDDVITIHNPKHTARFDRDGVLFTPVHGPEWHWQPRERVQKITDRISPQYQPGRVDYDRGAYIERYLLKQNTIEQRFILKRAPADKQDLIVRGVITSAGTFRSTAHGWQWRNDSGEINLGQVTVFDAAGTGLEASMQVTATGSVISVAANELANAVYPVTVDPEIGSGDVRLSNMPPDGDAIIGAHRPAVAYNTTDNEYLVVWDGGALSATLDGGYEIYGQRVNAATGAELGGDIRLSDMGPDSDLSFNAFGPAVAYNATNNEYLVVWSGDDDSGALVDNEYEVFGQRVNAATGAELGGDIRLSDMGPDGNAFFGARGSAVAYNVINNEYLVVWYGSDDNGAMVSGEHEIFGQRVAATGAELGGDIRLSDMGPDGDSIFDASEPAVAHNSTNNEYLVVWHGDDGSGTLIDNEYEIFGQRVAATGAELGGDVRLSDMGPDGDSYFTAHSPAVAYNSTNNEYMLVWRGYDDSGTIAFRESEIFGQRVAATGAELGGDVRLSDMGPDGDVDFHAFDPAVTYNATNNEYMVVWSGDDDSGAMVNSEYEIFGQRVNAATGAELGGDIRLSDMGPDGNVYFDAHNPAVAYNATNNQVLVVWHGRDGTDPVVDNEHEIFSQRFASAATLHFSGADLSVNENAGIIDIEVQRTGVTTSVVTVDFASSNGSATEPDDYIVTSGTLTFNAGEISKTIAVQIVDNNENDGNRSINLGLSNPQSLSGEVALDATRTSVILTIVDDDKIIAGSGGALSWWIGLACISLLLRHLRRRHR